jgi:hypothetical protein
MTKTRRKATKKKAVHLCERGHAMLGDSDKCHLCGSLRDTSTWVAWRPGLRRSSGLTWMEENAAHGVCGIHGTELLETRLADVENGPSPDDCENELVCVTCMQELAYAPADCLPHHRPTDECATCFYGEFASHDSELEWFCCTGCGLTFSVLSPGARNGSADPDRPEWECGPCAAAWDLERASESDLDSSGRLPGEVNLPSDCLR